MTTTIEVNKQSVKEFLATGKNNPFVIPEYQRPYAWEEEHIRTLFDDLWEFSLTIDSESNRNQPSYFLGCIVSFENDAGEQEIIDGQQRITSLFLLLRAIYTKLQNSEPSDYRNFSLSEIEKSIWHTHRLTGGVDYSDILLSSRVMNNDGNEILRNILTTGQSDVTLTDNYSKNYRKFQEYLENVAQRSPMNFYNFIQTILNQAILLPISADTQDTALTIFSTLNDRGLPLSDADIFKAKIYNNQIDANSKDSFIQDWQELDERVEYVSESIQHLFYYYMFYLRALDKDRNTTTPGLRKYYADNKFQKLLIPELMEDLAVITNLWQVVNRHESLSVEERTRSGGVEGVVVNRQESLLTEEWSEDIGICQSLDILNSYPNEFWKYPVVIYYLTHRKKDNFKESFALFLHKLILELTTKYVITPTINAVKTNILKLNAEIINSQYPKFDFMGLTNESILPLRENLIIPHRNILRMLLKILAYYHQDSLLPDKWEIEHIFPIRYQDMFFRDFDKECIEHIGNKIPFEKRLNIIASNGYFQKKKLEYRKSKIRIAYEMSDSDVIQWDDKCILQRDSELIETILSIFKEWDAQYTDKLQEVTSNT